MIKTIFFDFDGVLTKEFNGSGNICENLCNAFPDLQYNHVLECYRAYCRKLLSQPGSYSGVWDDFCSCLGQQIPIDALPDALRTVTRNDNMWDLIESLRSKYKLGIVTDNSQERMQLIDADMRLSEIFDPIIISASVSASKHSGTTDIFDIALERAGCQPEEAVFIDNQEKNLKVPAEMGMKTFWHDDAENDVTLLRTALREWGIDVAV